MKEIELITSVSNPLVKRIKRLQEKTKRRQKEKAFFVEGVPITLTAFESQASIEMIVFCDALLTEEKGDVALSRQKARARAGKIGRQLEDLSTAGPIIFSAKTREGREDIWKIMRQIAGID